MFYLNSVKHIGKILLRPDYRRVTTEKSKLRKTPRYTRTSTSLLGRELILADSASFLFMYGEVFEQEIYRFKPCFKNPFIIDAGANIGLSVIYFKQLCHDAKVIAFEPDPTVFSILQENIENFGFENIDLINKALWNSESTIEFMAEGADGGRIVKLDGSTQTCQVETTRLRPYLEKPVDFLKIDIEGAETEVLKDCKDLLGNVENIFVEYHSFADQPQTLDVVIKILSDAGFRLHIHPPVTSPQPFFHRNIHLGMDMQLNIFAFRD